MSDQNRIPSSNYEINRMVGRLEGKMDGIERQMGEIKELLKCKSQDCMNCRREVDDNTEDLDNRLAILENEKNKERAVEGFLDTTLGRVSLICGIGLGITGFVLGLI
jgi:hypothetical protein